MWQPKLLVVDDSEICRQPFRKVGIDKQGQQMVGVLEAETAEVGLELFKANPEILYAVVDVHLPGMDGFEMLNQCKKHDPERFERTTIFMSCSNADEHGHTSPNFPDPSWILKPIDPELFNRYLLSDVRMHMAMRTATLNSVQRDNLRVFFEESSQLTDDQYQALVGLVNSLSPKTSE